MRKYCEWGRMKTRDKLTVVRFSVTFVSRRAVAVGCYLLVDQGKTVDTSKRTEI